MRLKINFSRHYGRSAANVIKRLPRQWRTLSVVIMGIVASLGVFTLSTLAADCSTTCYLRSASDAPSGSELVANDNAQVALGVKFQADITGSIKGIRFYKGDTTSGIYTGKLWNASGGTALATTTTTLSSAGWQQINFSTPVAVSKDTTYVASYHTSIGKYSATPNYYSEEHRNGPLLALASGTGGGNGVFGYGANTTFPSSSANGTSYWVDVDFDANSSGDTTAPTLSSVTPASSATNIGTSRNLTAKFSESMKASSITSSSFELRDSSNNVVPAAAVAYDPSAKTATFDPASDLAASTTYTATLKGGSTDPRVKDTADNALASDYSWSFTTGTSACGSMNPVACENDKLGNATSEWDIGDGTSGSQSIQGFATDASINTGGAVGFKIKTAAATATNNYSATSTADDYTIDIYRVGYYAGKGARKVATIPASSTSETTQPACNTDSSTGLIDCGNWAQNASWTATDAVSGVYVATLRRTDDTTKASQILFTVRNDSSNSDILYQTSDTTWGAAYNDYGGNSLYTGNGAIGRAFKVSYNRPLNTRGTTYKRTNFFANEQPMIRWMESNGYDVSYSTGVDTNRQPASEIQEHKMFMSSGHDEYWSKTQRDNVEAARAAGVNLSFFSGNEIYWKTRWEDSSYGTNTANRTLVTYKETSLAANGTTVVDPDTQWTGTWRDANGSDAGKPENGLTGNIFTVNCCSALGIKVPEADGKMRLWRNTSVAGLSAGSTATLTPGTIGFEWDEDLDNGSRPAGTFRMSATPEILSGNRKVQNSAGGIYGPGRATHSLTLYRDQTSSALVFGAGSARWSWGLDSKHDDGVSSPDTAMQQATVNLFADMDNIQPATLQPGLSAATQSSDTTAPTSAITSPATSATVRAGEPVDIVGTAVDNTGGGKVGGVEVSVDGGTSWHRANGRADWSYTATFSTSAYPNGGTVTIMSRATDDSANIGTSATTGTVNQITVTINPALGSSYTIFNMDQTPTTTASTDTSANELGVKFKSDKAGVVKGIRFYKGAGNTGTHTGSLWKTDGTQLGTSVTFTSETASGWQQATFSTPIAIDANTTYVASYYAPNGHYAADNQYFRDIGQDSGVLHALVNTAGTGNGNGVFKSGTSGYPNSTSNSNNYWVDVVFEPALKTVFTSTETPTTAASSDATHLELGVKFKASSAGWVKGVRFYKGSTNTGTHVGNLWTSSGTRLAAATFTNESSTGWQQVNFSTPVAVDGNSTYIASYYAPNGHYAADGAYFATADKVNSPLTAQKSISGNRNGVYTSVAATVGQDTSLSTTSAFPINSFNDTNYWVDVVFEQSLAPAAPTSLSSTSTTATQVSLSWTASTSSNIAGYKIYRDGIQIATTTGTGTTHADNSVNGSTSYAYTVKAYDATGNTSTDSNSLNVTTPSPATTNIFGTSTPATAAASDSVAVEVGVKFRSSVSGTIKGVRFYKGSTNTGIHIGNLWLKSTGANLATATFTNESASGWQQVNFSTPVSVSANTTYVASYYAPNGHYAQNTAVFGSASVTNGSLSALASTIDGSNGVYTYGSASAYPSTSFNNSNYWVDVVFVAD
jgi:hypothetical protein